MSPGPKETGRDFFERLDPCMKAQAECARIIYESVEGAKAKLGGNPVKFIGLILDGDCVHPVIAETRISETRNSDSSVVENHHAFYALGGEGFGGLYEAIVGIYGSVVQWASGKSYYRAGEWISGADTYLRISTEGEVASSVGVIFFPREMVEKEHSVKWLLGLTKVVFDPETFTPLLRGLKTAAGLE